MTELEWLEGPVDLRFVEHLVRHGSATDRKLWLLSVGHCRCLWHLLSDWERETLLLAERCADGGPGDKELYSRFLTLSAERPEILGYSRYVHYVLMTAAHTRRALVQGGYQMWQKSDAGEVGVLGRAALVSPVCSHASTAETIAHPDGPIAGVAMQDRIYRVFRDLFGNPFRPVSLHSSWSDRSIRSFSRRIYRQHDFARMPRLAEALIEKGHPEDELVEHCRNPAEHFRGCWALDLLLGKT